MRRRMAASDVCERGWFADSTRMQKEGEIIVPRPLFFFRERRDLKKIFFVCVTLKGSRRDPLCTSREQVEGNRHHPPSHMTP